MRHVPQHLGGHRDRPCPLRSTCHSGLRDYEEKRCDALRDKKMILKAIQPSSTIDTFVCHVCGRLCAPRIGLHSHNRTHDNTNTDCGRDPTLTSVEIRRTDGSLHSYIHQYKMCLRVNVSWRVCVFIIFRFKLLFITGNLIGAIEG